MNALNVPPTTSTSANSKSVLDWPSVNVSAAVEVPPRVRAELVIDTGGKLLSIEYVCAGDPGFIPVSALPAISVTVGTLTNPIPRTPL